MYSSCQARWQLGKSSPRVHTLKTAMSTDGLIYSCMFGRMLQQYSEPGAISTQTLSRLGLQQKQILSWKIRFLYLI
jgi:hypothetical protein